MSEMCRLIITIAKKQVQTVVDVLEGVAKKITIVYGDEDRRSFDTSTGSYQYVAHDKKGTVSFVEKDFKRNGGGKHYARLEDGTVMNSRDLIPVVCADGNWHPTADFEAIFLEHGFRPKGSSSRLAEAYHGQPKRNRPPILERRGRDGHYEYRLASLLSGQENKK